MKTPIADFVRRYQESGMVRFHMPGHKGAGFLGCESFDITEIAGADELYDARGIIAESERNAASLFGAGRTFYSTEGSSQCIRAMLRLAMLRQTGGTPLILAARNVHKAFVYGAALLGLEVRWLWPEETDSLCSCRISPAQLEAALAALRSPPCTSLAPTIWAAWRMCRALQRSVTGIIRCCWWTMPTARTCIFWKSPCIRWIWGQTCAAIPLTRPCRC